MHASIPVQDSLRPSFVRLLLAMFACAASWPAHAAETAPDGAPGIDLRITLAVDPLDPPAGYNACGTASTLQVFTGENVRWCYRVTNNAGTTLTRHDLETSRFGVLLTNFPYTLPSGANAYLSQVEPVTTTMQGNATWRAYTPDTPDDFSDTAVGRVIVRSGIEVVATASIDPLVLPPNYDACGTQTVVSAIPGRNVRWCYTVRNVSSIDRSRHDLDTSEGGMLLAGFPYTLAAGATAFLTRTQPMSAAAIEEVAMWTAFRPGPVHVSTATAIARVLAVGDRIFVSRFE